jgi:hypothetical protein
VISKAADVGDAWPRSAVEDVCGLKSGCIEQGFVDIKMTLILGEGIRSRQHGWNAAHGKLAGNIAVARAEER